MPFLKTQNTDILNGGKKIKLRGVNFGGWLMMEAYFMQAPARPEKEFRAAFVKLNGRAALKDFDVKFRGHFIREEDMRTVARWGMNCVRVPFHFRLIEKKPFQMDPDGIRYLDEVVRWAKKYKVWAILDMHAVPGSQNHDWHSDSAGRADFWKTASYQKRALAIWKYVAGRYADEPWVAGYDILYVAVLSDITLLNQYYQKAVTAIRSVDKNHILFIEGSRWAMDIEDLDVFDDDNYVISIHHYIPLEFTFNYISFLRYPLEGKKHKWNKTTTMKYLSKYKKIADRRKVPVFVGEFGVNAREGLYGEDRWLKDTVDCFNQLGFHWTYWTYKAVKNNLFPDGIFSYRPNPPWVHREGPLTGWQTYPVLWKKNKNQMARSWKTKEFTLNEPVLKVLKNACR